MPVHVPPTDVIIHKPPPARLPPTDVIIHKPPTPVRPSPTLVKIHPPPTPVHKRTPVHFPRAVPPISRAPTVHNKGVGHGRRTFAAAIRRGHRRH
jgi:hypothetical protein